jgi:predicted CopG family antitoxin
MDEENIINEETEKLVTIKVKESLADELYVLKGRARSYGEVISDLVQKGKDFEEVQQNFDEYKQTYAKKGNQYRGKIKKLQNLIKKTGNADLMAQMEEALRDDEDGGNVQN